VSQFAQWSGSVDGGVGERAYRLALADGRGETSSTEFWLDPHIPDGLVMGVNGRENRPAQPKQTCYVDQIHLVKPSHRPVMDAQEENKGRRLVQGIHVN
jgi:hypothetical protein